MGRVGIATGEVMAVLVTATKDFPGNIELVRQLRSEMPELTSIQQNINPARTNVILGRETRVLWGEPVIHDRIGRFSFQISAESFFQVNAVQTQVLYEQAVAKAGLTGRETVFDLYSGTGTISLFLAEQAAHVYGIEYSTAAVADAGRNAANNQSHNVTFLAGDVAEKIQPGVCKIVCASVLSRRESSKMGKKGRRSKWQTKTGSESSVRNSFGA